MIDTIKTIIVSNQGQIKSYLTLLGGSAGRLIISLFYFILVANSLDVEGFGLFATASATGIILSRFLAFGLVSPLYRIATAKYRLLGVYTTGLLLTGALSLPVIFVIAFLIYETLFSTQMTWITFIAIVLAEVVFWRGLEITIIVLNGLNKFFISSCLLVMGTLFKLVAAVYLAFLSSGALADWGILYLIANGASCLIAMIFFYPKVRLRLNISLYKSRWVESLSVASSEVIFYAQAEFDKLIVLAIGGAQIAGIYSILMRLIDLTALPIRSLITLLVQKLIRSKAFLKSAKNIVMIEILIGFISLCGISMIALCLHLYPNLLGENVAQIAPFVALTLLVPVFRNLIETHSELLYAVNLTVRRTVNLATLGAFKAALIFFLIKDYQDHDAWIWMLNFAFMAVYISSAILSYGPIKREISKA